MKALSFLLVSLLFIPLLQTEMAYPHVFYVSITRVKWDLSRTVLDISVRIFTDDLEEAILADQTRRLSLLRAKKKLNREDFVKDYIESRLAFQKTTDTDPVDSDDWYKVLLGMDKDGHPFFRDRAIRNMIRSEDEPDTFGANCHGPP